MNANPHTECIDISNLSPDGKRIVRYVITKFIKGAAYHGNKTNIHDGSNWTRELLNEQVDALFYAVMLLMQKQENGDLEQSGGC